MNMIDQPLTNLLGSSLQLPDYEYDTHPDLVDHDLENFTDINSLDLGGFPSAGREAERAAYTVIANRRTIVMLQRTGSKQ